MQLITQMREVNDRYPNGEAFSADDEQIYQRLEGELETLNRSIQRRETLGAHERGLEGHPPMPAGAGGDPNPSAVERDQQVINRYMQQYRSAGGFNGMDRAAAEVLRTRIAHERDVYARVLRGDKSALVELRDLSVGTPTSGGNTVLPLALHTELIDRIEDETYMRQICTVLTPLNTAESIGVVTIDANPDDADWTTELSAGTSDSGMAFGRRPLKPEHLAKRIKISRRLLQISSFDIVSLVLSKLAYKFGVTAEKAMMTGDGTDKPLGIFTASSTGISTARDITEQMTSTLVTDDALINLTMALKPGYRSKAAFIMHTNILKQVRKIKDQDEQYVFQPGLQLGQPDTLLGRPIYESQYAPSAAAPNGYAMVFGDFKKYFIQDSYNMEILRLDELFAGTNEIGFDGHFWTDAMPIHEEAFARLKFAAGS